MRIFNIKVTGLCLLMGLFLGLTLTQAAHAQSLHNPTGSDVQLRSGDIIKISVPGEPDFDTHFTVDTRGSIQLPEVGQLQLNGQTLDQALVSIRRSLAPIYRNLDRVSLQLVERRLSVMVLGYVKQPGPVSLAPGATVQMALNAAGGLSPGAQLDRLQIRRHGEVRSFDYKRYLDSGDPSLLPVLQPMDQVFVPASPLTGNVQIEFDAKTLSAAGDAADETQSITVFGEVHRPGAFAYKPGLEVIDMLMRAGGVTRYAGIEQIRVISRGQPYPFNMREYLDTGRKELMPAIANGDILFVPQASEQIRMGSRTVFVMGEVFKPGAFETKSGASFLDLLANAGGPTRFAETRQIRILRPDGQVQQFDMQAYTEGTGVAALPRIQPGDAILVPEKTDQNEKSWLKIPTHRAVRVIGAVQRPGRYEWSAEMNLMDIIAHVGGPRSSADTAHLQIIRSDGGIVDFNLKRYLSQGEPQLPQLAAGDTLLIPELPKDPNDNRSQWIRQSSNRSIYIMGQVGAPGRYAFNEELNFLDILSAAQGPTSQADLVNIRISHRNGEQMQVTRLNLHHYFETGDENLLPHVQPEDVIFIPDRGRDWLQKSRQTTIRVLGAVGKPGRYNFNDDMTLLDLLAEAGGPQSNALQDRIVVINKSTGQDQARVFDLEAFAKTADFSTLPVLRNGDTVYVPGEEQSGWNTFSKILRTTLSTAALIALF